MKRTKHMEFMEVKDLHFEPNANIQRLSMSVLIFSLLLAVTWEENFDIVQSIETSRREQLIARVRKVLYLIFGGIEEESLAGLYRGEMGGK